MDNEDAAACHGEDPELWFPQGEAGKKSRRKARDTARAVAICNRCEIRDDCLDYALTRRMDFGIWGARTEAERTRLRATRAKQAKQESAPEKPAPRVSRQRSTLPTPEPSDVRGVSWNAWKGRWVVIIRHGGKRLQVGTFRHQEAAEAAAIAKCEALGITTVRSRTGKKAA